MEISRSNIFDVIKLYGASPDKDYGQNFLVEPTISKNIVNLLNLEQEDKVLEVGPGLGSLTHFMVDNSHLTVCDIDPRMTSFIKFNYGEKVEIILNDIRKVNVSKYDKIIGNLPYNITTELVTYLLLNARGAKKMVLMCQVEAFNHFNDVSGKEYGPISVLLHLLGVINKELVVKAGSFHPVPKCNSLVFSFTYNEDINWDEALGIYKLAKVLFLNRRKTIYNNLKNYLSSGEKAEKVLDSLKIEKNLRPEQLSPDVYSDLYKTICLKWGKIYN